MDCKALRAAVHMGSKPSGHHPPLSEEGNNFQRGDTTDGRKYQLIPVGISPGRASFAMVPASGQGPAGPMAALRQSGHPDGQTGAIDFAVGHDVLDQQSAGAHFAPCLAAARSGRSNPFLVQGPTIIIGDMKEVTGHRGHPLGGNAAIRKPTLLAKVL